MKQEIQVLDYAKEITSALNKGVLLTTKNGNKINMMTIGWGTLGTIWNRPIFTIYVREGRFTREQLDASGEFTVNIPYGTFDHKIIGYCGSRTGRAINKAQDLQLTLVDSDLVQAPGIKELPLTLECKILYRQPFDPNAIPEDIRKTCYPPDVESTNPMANKDYHVAYFGQVVKAYLIK